MCGVSACAQFFLPELPPRTSYAVFPMLNLISDLTFSAVLNHHICHTDRSSVKVREGRGGEGACERACERASVRACVRACVRARACVYVCVCVCVCK